MNKRLLLSLALTVGLVCLGIPAKAAANEFYKGETIRFIVGFAPGGGYDTYTRAVARHIGRHIPGNQVLWWKTWIALEA
jgi:tripartite-type tricarboxylate transporter receptor subunit TctC